MQDDASSASIETGMEEQITITLPDNTKRSIPKGTKLQELANEEAVAAHIDGALVDLSQTIGRDASISFISIHSKKGLEILRHSAAHVMAQAVKELFPTVKLTFGPATDSGFYYDFDYERPFTPQDLELIQNKALEIIKQDLPFVRKEVLKIEAIKTFQEMGESYKIEHLEELPDRVSLYRQGTFVDLCKGPTYPPQERLKPLGF